MTSASVSIIVPTCNRASMLPQALDSLLHQDYEPLELIVIDNGSDDTTQEVLAEYVRIYGPERLRQERQLENLGQARAINRGYELAAGVILGYLSDDDWLLPGAVRIQVQALHANPQADVVYGPNYLVDDAGTILDTVMPRVLTFAEAVRTQQYSIGAGALIRRSLYERIGGWNPDYVTCPDAEFFLRAGSALKHAVVSEVVAAHRVHPARITDAFAGVTKARERLMLLDSLYASDQLARELEDVRQDAYANCFFLGGAMTAGDRLNTEGQRYALFDDQVIDYSRLAQKLEADEGPWRSFRVEALTRQVQLHIRIIEIMRERLRVQEETISALDLLAAEREQERAERVSAGRQIVRALIPSQLRRRVGPLVYRARRLRARGPR